MSQMGTLKLVLLSFLLFLLPVALHSANTYNVGDRVPLFVNKIGPLHNPSETYKYYESSFCRPDHVLEKKESLGEILNGDRLANTLYDLEFAVNKPGSVLCQHTLNKGEITKFRKFIKNDFYYQMYYDDLPLWAFIGKVENESVSGKRTEYFMFSHVRFDALYNGNRVIEIHAFSDPSHVIDVTEDVDVEVEFTYSVFWNATSTLYNNRMDRYSGASSLPVLRRTHLFSLVNSIVILIVVLGLLTVLFMRHLKNDLRRWSTGAEDEEKEVCSKNIHGDVLRCPTNLPLFSAFRGCGTQLLIMVSFLFILAFLGVLYPYSHGALSSSVIVAYVLTSAVASYFSTSFCCRYAETGWGKSVILAVTLFLGPFLLTTLNLNIMATYFGTTSALPLRTISVILLLYTISAIPLLGLGVFLGLHYKCDLQSPGPVAKKSPREVPDSAWYRKTPAQMFIGGLLPFSAVVLEFHNFCATVWGYKIYTSPGILFITFVILVLLTAMLSVVLTYFQLDAEDHEWWWRSVLRGGSTSIFMFVYCVYFYFKSSMVGILQTSFFFGYNFCMCYALFLMLGTVSFQASSLFVRRLYSAVKSE